MKSSEIHLTKLSSAKKQLQAAIRMYFMEEDELAIHTIASAVYSVLKDLKKNRGKDEVDDIFNASLNRLVSEYKNNSLSNEILSNPSLMELLKQLADTAEFSITTSKETKKAYWKESNKSSNFLKHADRDISDTLNLDSIDNTTLLMKCLNSYLDIIPEYPGVEGDLFYRYAIVVIPELNNFGWESDSLLKSLEMIPKEELKKFCYGAINSQNINHR